LRLPTPTLLVEQGFAGFFGCCDLHSFRSAAAHRQPLCTMLFPRSPGFRFAAVRWSDACRNALFAGARTVQRLPRRLNDRSRSEETAASPFDMSAEQGRSAGSRELSSTGFRHGGLAAAPLSARN